MARYREEATSVHAESDNSPLLQILATASLVCQAEFHATDAASDAEGLERELRISLREPGPRAENGGVDNALPSPR